MSTGEATYKAVQRDVTRLIQQGYDSATPFYPTLCTIVQSTGEDEKYSWLGDMPGMREWLGPRQFKQIEAADYAFPNKHWESSLEFQKTKIDDDRIGMLANIGRQLGEEARFHPDELLLEAITNAESAECFDGQYFFDTDHSWGDSGTQSNDISYDAADKDDMTPAEIREVIDVAATAMKGFKRDNGKPYMRPRIEPLSNLLMVVPLAYDAVARKALSQSIVVEGGAGVSNFISENVQVLALQDFPTNKIDVYHLGDSMLKPYVFQDRQPLRVQSKGADDIEFKEIKWMTEARYNIGYLAWWKAVRVTIATAT